MLSGPQVGDIIGLPVAPDLAEVTQRWSTVDISSEEAHPSQLFTSSIILWKGGRGRCRLSRKCLLPSPQGMLMSLIL